MHQCCDTSVTEIARREYDAYESGVVVLQSMEEILVEIGGCVDDSSKPLHSSISNRRERAPGSGGGGDSEPFY